MSDKEYIERICNGNQYAFTTLYDKSRQYVTTTLLEIFRGRIDRYEVEDVYNNIMMIFWEKLAKNSFEYRDGVKITTYLIEIGKRVIYRELRKRGKEFTVINENTVFTEPELDIAINERDRVIREMVENMGEPCSSLLDKFYWDALSGEEIAKELKYANSNVVKTQKYKCMKKIADKLGEILKAYI